MPSTTLAHDSESRLASCGRWNLSSSRFPPRNSNRFANPSRPGTSIFGHFSPPGCSRRTQHAKTTRNHPLLFGRGWGVRAVRGSAARVARAEPVKWVTPCKPFFFLSKCNWFYILDCDTHSLLGAGSCNPASQGRIPFVGGIKCFSPKVFHATTANPASQEGIPFVGSQLDHN